MHIILTHEQADFDAIASLLGARLLDERRVPVLPRKINRNVRAFLTLYGVDLPFVEARDLPGTPVTNVTLVDTQSLISVKGMSAETRVHVIDHHPLREDLPSDWDITVAGTGANTTIFIENLRERPLVLSTIQATLLLLGIYEDTGSLTYTRTTARDLLAASYLLEHGASLQIAADFLNHPLTAGQQTLYEHLWKNAEHHHVHGHTVIVACGDAQDVDEELSTIAHKLRDFLDPDALFMLITTRGGVQLIARSTSDNINVAALAAEFGGGGHERAAAGLIKDRPLEEVRRELVEKLPKFVQPAITVAQIMSRDPQTIPADTPVQKVAERMRRYGYEGYPVVRQGALIGLLTRRAVDRALNHKLNLTAEALMDAGSHTVNPDDSLDYLQRLMTETGWGQIPVVNPQDGDIIGIVTRTDLLKTLAPQRRAPSRQSLAEKLESALPPARLRLLQAVAKMAYEQRLALYIVGGFVRDLLLGRPSIDFDLVVEGDAIKLARALAHKYGGRVTSHARFGTAKWYLGEQWQVSDDLKAADLEEPAKTAMPPTLDFVTARIEFYTHPTALPTVERGSIKLDLHRRDFTINTLALRLDGHHYGELHDYWGGLADLEHGIVRVLHSLSFVDDPTRILRAVRFEQRFGFRIDERTLELLHAALSLLDRVSGDRLRHELNSILQETHAAQTLARLDSLGILSAIHPELQWDEWLAARFDAVWQQDLPALWLPPERRAAGIDKSDLLYILWLLRLPSGQAINVSARLKLSSNLVKSIRAACHLWQTRENLVDARPSAVVERLADVPHDALIVVYHAAENGVRQVIGNYMARWQHVSPTITGRDLRALGVPPGPIYKQILNRLRAAWLDDEITTPEEEAALLDRLILENQGKKG